MWLTGRAEGPMLGCPRGVIDVMDGAAHTLAAVTRRVARPVVVDGPALLGERATLLGFQRHGDVSCGGGTRLLRTANGWIALSLARPDDAELLPAWLGVQRPADPWPAIIMAVCARAASEVVDSGVELGLPVAHLGERAHDRAAVAATRLGDAPPLARLEALRVVDLSSLWAGPLAGQLLAAAGMDVVKIESTRRPDGARRGPAAFYDLMNAAKASVALDLEARAEVDALRRLLLSADVVIESSRPRALEQLGVDAAEIVSTGTARVWLSITGHGRDDPHRHRVAFGDDAAVAGGLVARDAIGPVFCADAIADPATGLLAATAVIDRLTAGGRWLVDVALTRAAALMATGAAVRWQGAVDLPRARPAAGRAAPLGRDTRRVLDGRGGGR
jgi:CoA-transferase family III